MSAWAADGVMVIHAAFVLFVALGAALVAWRPGWAWLHVPAVAWGAWITLSGGICPLTPLENALRLAAGQAGYEEGFIAHYARVLIYPPGLTRSVQIGIGIAAIVFNVGLYALAWHRRQRHCAPVAP